MPANIPLIRFDIAQPMFCSEHLVRGPIMCCPFPGCTLGTHSDTIETNMPGSNLKIWRRAVWRGPGNALAYSWRDDLPMWFGFERVMWREAYRRRIAPIQSYPPIMYHYTSVEGLYGILQTNEVWLSEYSFMNDMAEISHGLSLVQKIFEQVAKVRPKAQNVLQAWGDTIKHLRSKIYIASFSLDGDSLSQWRGYGPIAIGFRNDTLSFGYSHASSTQTVIYDHDRQTQFVELIAHLCATAYENDGIEDLMRETYEDGSDKLLSVAAFFKHQSFADEREVRMVFVENPRMAASFPKYSVSQRYRLRNGIIVPYVTTRDIARSYPDLLPIEEIVIGPHQQSELLERGIKELLDARGYKAVSVRRSTAPFRP